MFRKRVNPRRGCNVDSCVTSTEGVPWSLPRSKGVLSARVDTDRLPELMHSFTVFPIRRQAHAKLRPTSNRVHLSVDVMVNVRSSEKPDEKRMVLVGSGRIVSLRCSGNALKLELQRYQSGNRR